MLWNTTTPLYIVTLNKGKKEQKGNNCQCHAPK